MLREHRIDARGVTDVAVDERVVVVVGDGAQRVGIAGVGQRVEIDDAVAAEAQHIEHEIAADEAGATSDEQGFHGAWSSGIRGQRARPACGSRDGSAIGNGPARWATIA